MLKDKTAAGYASAIGTILGNRAERARLEQAGRVRMLSHHAWDRSMQRLDAIIERCVGEHMRRAAKRAPAAGAWRGGGSAVPYDAPTMKP
jgi:hypothetical protein